MASNLNPSTSPTPMTMKLRAEHIVHRTNDYFDLDPGSRRSIALDTGLPSKDSKDTFLCGEVSDRMALFNT